MPEQEITFSPPKLSLKRQEMVDRAMRHYYEVVLASGYSLQEGDIIPGEPSKPKHPLLYWYHTKMMRRWIRRFRRVTF
jgi:hypothetical protein